jgi:Zn-dependent alcohol dehydrogenase
MDEREFKIYAPLGCAFQASTRSIAKLCKASPADVVVVLGVGGVGLVALMVRTTPL